MTTEEKLACLYVGAVAFGLSMALAPMARGIAEKFGVLDQPNERKVHDRPKPLLGGVALFATLLIIIVGHIVIFPYVRNNQAIAFLFPTVLSKLGTIGIVYPALLSLLVGSLIIFLVGLLDDIYGPKFPVWAKLTGQTLAALLVVSEGVHISLFGFNPFVAGAVTLVWIVGITNAFNLLDNMDGLSAGVGIVCGVLLLIIAGSLGELYISLFLAVLVGALSGFLTHNFHPARIFLGDAGSLLVGYLFGVITVLASYVAREGTIQNTFFAPFMPVIVLGLPLYDTASVVVIRLLERRPVYRGDRRHLSHRLMDMGMTHRQAVLVVYLLTFCLGVSAIFLKEASPAATLLALCQSLGIVGLTTILMLLRRKTYYVQIDAFNGESPSKSEEDTRTASSHSWVSGRNASPQIGYKASPREQTKPSAQ